MGLPEKQSGPEPYWVQWGEGGVKDETFITACIEKLPKRSCRTTACPMTYHLSLRPTLSNVTQGSATTQQTSPQLHGSRKTLKQCPDSNICKCSNLIKFFTEIHL